MKKAKYPQLADKDSWTPIMLYVHQRAMAVGLILGLVIGISITMLAWIVALEVTSWR